MKWLLDIGNSRYKCGFYRDGAIVSRDSIEPSVQGLRALLAANIDTVESVWVASVVGSSTNKKIADMVATFDLRAHFVEVTGRADKIKMMYQSNQLGVDRFVCLIAAWQRARRSCIIADCGTATTIDYIDGDGEHRGGVIFPGLATAYKGLHRGTHALPLGIYSDDHTVFATSTEVAIESGCRYMLIAGVKEVVKRMRDAGDLDAPLILTGGLGELVCAEIGERSEYIRDLSLEGIAVLSEGEGS